MRSRLNRAVVALVGASLAGAVTVVTAPAAGAGTALCGTTITTSTTLTEDVGPCPDYGIIIGANNITLDLAGHTIFGIAGQPLDGAGVYVPNKTGVTVRNGTVRHFDGGVVIQGGSGNTVTGIRAFDNIGVFTTAASADFGEGILIFNSSNNRVISNVAENNGPFGGIDLLGNSDNNVVQSNISQNNVVATDGVFHPGTDGPTQQNDGMRLETFGGAPNFNVIQNNTLRGNGLDGIAVFPGANDNRIVNNVIERNGMLGNARAGDGIHLFGFVFRTFISGNRVTENARDGIRIDASPSNPPPALNNVITRNVSVNNARRPLFDPAFDLNDQNRFCDNNSWTQNVHYTEEFPGTDCIN
jgi:hypothetical protein